MSCRYEGLRFARACARVLRMPGNVSSFSVVPVVSIGFAMCAAHFGPILGCGRQACIYSQDNMFVCRVQVHQHMA